MMTVKAIGRRNGCLSLIKIILFNKLFPQMLQHADAMAIQQQTASSAHAIPLRYGVRTCPC